MQLMIKQKASELRKKFGYYESESINVHSLLRKNNLLTVFKSLDSGFSGMTIIENEIPFILINSNQSIGRQNFTICHELFHIYFDSDFKPHKCFTGVFNSKDTTEFMADLFAAYFLLPEEGVLNSIPEDQLTSNRITLETILVLEHYFQVSRRALLMRLRELEIIDTGYFTVLTENIIANALSRGYPDTLYRPGNNNLIIGDYGVIAKQLFDVGKISESHYAELMVAIGVNVFNLGINNDEQ